MATIIYIFSYGQSKYPNIYHTFATNQSELVEIKTKEYILKKGLTEQKENLPKAKQKECMKEWSVITAVNARNQKTRI